MNDAALSTQPAASNSPPEGADAGTRIFTGSLFRVRDGRAWAFTTEPPAPPPPQVRRPARVALALARAHRLEAAIAAGDYADRADAARQLGFTRARITQILDLLLLAPDLQERVLGLEAVDGVEPMSERALRDVVRHEAWGEQRGHWDRLAGRHAPDGSAPSLASQRPHGPVDSASSTGFTGAAFVPEP